jgi:proteasome lid subunit RPN8/RPN11
MNTHIKSQIIALAHQTPNEEICGFIYYTPTNELKVYPANNIAYTSRANDFEIDPVDYLRCDSLGVIVGIYHSHPSNQEAFSPCDLEYIEEVGVPLYLYTVGTGKWQEFIPATYNVDLIRLPYIWGLYDCYSIIRNGLRQRVGIHIPDYDRDESFGSDEKSKGEIINHIDIFNCVIIGRGRHDLNKLQVNDILLFNTPSRSRTLPVHLGLFVGDSNFIHHPEHQLSCKQFLDGEWINKINLIIRHKSFVKSCI